MKRILRAVLFSAVALFLTSLYNKGFVISYDAPSFIKTALLIAVFYYVLVPAVKLLLTPLTIVTLGLASFLSYFFLFYLLVIVFPFIKILPWSFNGYAINYIANIALSAASVALIINILDHLL